MWSFYCLLAISGLSHAVVSSDQRPLGQAEQARYLIETQPGLTRWVLEEEKWELKRAGVNFMDITADTFDENNQVMLGAQVKHVTYPTHIKHNGTVSSLFAHLDKSRMYDNLDAFTSFHTRYYKSEYGAQSSAWLYKQIKQVVEHSGADKSGATVEAFPHPWGQSSIIATIPGQSNHTVVVGAHQDSINLFLPSVLAAPGADDDGSGTVTILESLRVLLKDSSISSGNATNTIEFHWYSAEEGGLLGSQAIFQKYAATGRDIKAMLQQDMTGYTAGTIEAGKPVSVGVITDFVDIGLTKFIKKVVKNYCTIPYVDTKCGYACSDHASASKAGYPSAFVIESEFKSSNKRIHTTLDTIDKLDFDHMLQHARLTLGFAYELAFAKF